MKYYFLLIFCLLFSSSFSQNSIKSIGAKRVDNAPTIDGEINDDAWKNVEFAKDFVMHEPSMGSLEAPERKTLVQVTYDDEAIYFAAQLYDDKPNDIAKQFGDRDNIGQVDYFR